MAWERNCSCHISPPCDNCVSRCADCEGEGFTTETRPACCGNVTSGGECRGDCAVPEQEQVPCQTCEGTGEIAQ